MWHNVFSDKHEYGLFAPEDWVNASHQRCAKLGLSRSASTCAYRLKDEELSKFLSIYKPMQHHARILFSEILAVLADKNQIFVLTDKRGYIIEIFSQPTLLERAANESGFVSFPVK